MKDPRNQAAMDEAVINLELSGAAAGMTPDETEAVRAEMDRYGRSLGPAVAAGRITMARAARMVMQHARRLAEDARRRKVSS